ncbi:hypothetical protein WJX72_007600 [[Myrmecia] bisecta]|uniref:Septin-type G domain-containing protein n=1 Tax=[Myrmecia] bisecta TaxID=41462 RepID=A0AAW1QR91_9CHLO
MAGLGFDLEGEGPAEDWSLVSPAASSPKHADLTHGTSAAQGTPAACRASPEEPCLLTPGQSFKEARQPRTPAFDPSPDFAHLVETLPSIRTAPPAPMTSLLTTSLHDASLTPRPSRAGSAAMQIAPASLASPDCSWKSSRASSLDGPPPLLATSKYDTDENASPNRSEHASDGGTQTKHKWQQAVARELGADASETDSDDEAQAQQQWQQTAQYEDDIRHACEAVLKVKPPAVERHMKILVVGDLGQGKSTFVKALLAAHTPEDADPSLAVPPHTTVEAFLNDSDALCSKMTITHDDIQTTMHYQVQDTPAYTGEGMAERILAYVKDQQRAYMAAELDPQRSRPVGELADPRVDVCLFFVPPHALKGQDVAFMEQLSELVPVVPLLAKADSMLAGELAAFRSHVHETLQQASAKLGRPIMYPFSEKALKEAGAPVGAPPFAVIASSHMDLSVGRFWPVRAYPWCKVDALASNHSDMLTLKQLLLAVAFEDLKKGTEARYLAFRKRQLTAKGSAAADKLARALHTTKRAERAVGALRKNGNIIAITALACFTLFLGYQAGVRSRPSVASLAAADAGGAAQPTPRFKDKGQQAGQAAAEKQESAPDWPDASNAPDSTSDWHGRAQAREAASNWHQEELLGMHPGHGEVHGSYNVSWQEFTECKHFAARLAVMVNDSQQRLDAALAAVAAASTSGSRQTSKLWPPGAAASVSRMASSIAKQLRSTAGSGLFRCSQVLESLELGSRVGNFSTTLQANLQNVSKDLKSASSSAAKSAAKYTSHTAETVKEALQQGVETQRAWVGRAGDAVVKRAGRFTAKVQKAWRAEGKAWVKHAKHVLSPKRVFKRNKKRIMRAFTRGGILSRLF